MPAAAHILSDYCAEVKDNQEKCSPLNESPEHSDLYC